MLKAKREATEELSSSMDCLAEGALPEAIERERESVCAALQREQCWSCLSSFAGAADTRTLAKEIDQAFLLPKRPKSN